MKIMGQFKIINIGSLKYDRIDAIRILRAEFYRRGIVGSISCLRDLIDQKPVGIVDDEIRYCINLVYNDTDYEEVGGYVYEDEQNFPDNYIPAIG